jgi:uncharacterized membrane protein
MLRKNIFHKLVTLGTLAAVWCVFSMVALAVPTEMSGVVAITGQVTVNGQPAVSNATIMSGATVTTAKGSNAVISLGKLGRIEIQEDSTLSLRFSDSGVNATLDSGAVRISGTSATVTTSNATFVGDTGQANNFVVAFDCAQSHVDTTSGIVSMNEGGKIQQVVAGNSAVAGVAKAGCAPRSSQGGQPHTSNLPWLLLLAAGAAGVGIYLGLRGEEGINGNATVASPSR